MELTPSRWKNNREVKQIRRSLSHSVGRQELKTGNFATPKGVFTKSVDFKYLVCRLDNVRSTYT